MKETGLDKRMAISIKEKGQYALAFGVIGVMLFAVGFPVFLLIFFGVLGFFVWKIFSPESRHEARKIFEFYLAASEMLREDDRRWFGFELQEAIGRGEAIVRAMATSPPLVHFGLGALYQKIGDHSLAAKHLAEAVESPGADEASIVFPAKELKEYVRLLRRIERAPAESPLTSAAVRSLERARKNRGWAMLADCRTHVGDLETKQLSVSADDGSGLEQRKSITEDVDSSSVGEEKGTTYRFVDFAQSKRSRKTNPKPAPGERQTISEVLHDIYDQNTQ